MVAAHCKPQRKMFDPLLAEAVETAGTELRDGFSVQEVAGENDRVVGIRRGRKNGVRGTEKGIITIGDDGVLSDRTAQLATFDPATPGVQQLPQALAENPEQRFPMAWHLAHTDLVQKACIGSLPERDG